MEERVYEYPPSGMTWDIISGIVSAGIAAYFIAISDFETCTFMILPLLGVGLDILHKSHMRLSKVVLTNSGIRVENALGTQELHWWEITNVSGSGIRIKLHNHDGDVTLEPDPHIPGYPEVIDFIGNKRDDLFEKEEFKFLSMAPLSLLLGGLIIGALVAGGAALLFFTAEAGFKLLGIVLAAIGFFIASRVLLSPYAISLEDDRFLLQYPFRKRTLFSEDIRSIGLKRLPYGIGTTYHVELLLADDEKVNLSGMRGGLPITYLALKRWLVHWQQVSLTTRFPGVLLR